jgi:hypothetical protein
VEQIAIQAVEIVGSLLILVAYVANLMKRLETSNLLYPLLNCAGSLTLTIIATIEQQWGFLLLEGVWALVSLWSLVSVLRSGQPSVGH